MGDSDAVLWRSWRAKRDAGAFDRLVRPHLAFASAFARRLGFRGQDADEVVQRSLVALAAETRETPVAVGVRAWIGRSVLSEARMLSRSDRRRAAREAAVARERGAVAAPSRAIESRDQVEAALALLDPEDRWLVELRFLHDLEYREIAFVTGRSALACRLRVHRALARLRRSLGPSAPLLVASIPLPRPPESAGVAVNRAVETATVEGVGAATVAGGLAVSTSSKVAISAGLLLLVGGGWFVATRKSEEATSRRWVDLGTDRRAAEAPRLLPAARSAGVADARDTGVPSPGSNASDSPVPGRANAKGHGSVEGTIRFDDGSPMANVRVSLTIGPREDGRDTTLTDAHGRFRLDDEWVGPRSLTLVQADGAVVILREITLEPDRVVSVDATVARGVTVSGTVVDARGREPVPGAWVTLRRPSQARAQAVYGGAKTDANGRFRFEHVPPAHVTVEFVRPGREPRLEVLDVGTRDVVLDVALSPSRPLVVRYEPVPKEAVGERVAWILEGPPIGPLERFLHGSRGEEAAIALSDAGELRLDAPPPGRYHLTLFGTKTLPRFETDFEVTESEAPVVLVPLGPAGRLTGTVVDAAGTPLSGVRVGLAGVVSDPTDGAGRFSFARVAAGSQEATVVVSGVRVRVPPVVVSAARDTSVELRMPGTARLSLTLTTPAPYSGQLDVKTPSGETVASGHVRTGRPVALTGLRSGPHVVSLWTPDRVTFRKTVTFEPGETIDLGEVALVAMPVVPVRVTLPPGVPPPPILSVHVRERTPPWDHGIAMEGRIEWDSDGHAWLKGLPAARYRVAIQWTPAAEVSDLPTFDIDVRDGIEAPIDLALR